MIVNTTLVYFLVFALVGMRKKAFFRETTKAEIKKGSLVGLDRIGGKLSGLIDLAEDEFLVIAAALPRGYESARKFMKHGPEVKPRRYYSLDQAVLEGKTPVQLREEAFDSLEGRGFCGYSFMPIGRDRRKRKVSLVECMEGARLYAYSHQVKGAQIIVRPYADSKRVRIDGAEVVVRVPSRTEKQGKATLKLLSVPVVDSGEKHGISLNLGSDHSCESKRFNIRYRYTDDKESSGIVNVCAHEIAAYLAVIDHFWDKKNMIPLQMCQYAIPSQKTVDFYLKLSNNLLIRDSSLKSKDKLRKLNRAEKEIRLWGLVWELGHDATFYSKRSRDGDVADYNWRVQ